MVYLYLYIGRYIITCDPKYRTVGMMYCRSLDYENLDDENLPKYVSYDVWTRIIWGIKINRYIYDVIMQNWN